jgi:hypothetical protein
MTVSARAAASPHPPRRAWPWAALVLALAWTVVTRVPLIVNAETHLDSDLAVDGLTLVEAIRGHWRWHYPGTPHMGIGPVLLSWPQARAWGASPQALVSGGTVAYAGLIVATFVLALRAFGGMVAAWSLVPLAFASTGALWLSGRVTGGHLTAAAWHAGGFALLHASLARGGRRTAAALGLWCGLGVYLDSMFVMTLAGLVPAAVAGWWASGRSRPGLGCALVFVPAFLAGAWPREVGARVDPHDAYQEQFRPLLDRDVLVGHARILALECLPRLIAGHRLPGLQADPNVSESADSGGARAPRWSDPSAVAVTAVGLALFPAALAMLAAAGSPRRDVAGWAVRWGLLLAAAAVVAGFITNRNIFNSDNYRYLVTLLVPWSVGFGLLLDRLARRGRGGRAAPAAIALILAGLMTLDTARWYARFGWIDARGRPVRRLLADPALAWLAAHREVDRIAGGYWDVYRLAFLTGGRVRGTPYANYPDRFPEWSQTPPRGRRVLIVRPSPEGASYRESALRAGGRVLHKARGLAIVSWP